MEHLSDNILNRGINQGISIGKKEGQSETKLETAGRMLKSGRYIDQEIADISGMKLEDVKNLKKQLLN